MLTIKGVVRDYCSIDHIMEILTFKSFTIDDNQHFEFTSSNILNIIFTNSTELVAIWRSEYGKDSIDLIEFREDY